MDMTSQMNNFVKTVEPNGISSFNQKIAGLPDLDALMVGEPDFDTPLHIKQAAIKAIQKNKSHYTNPRGILPLRQHVARFLKDKYNLNYDPKNQILVTAGVTEGLSATFGAILNPGNEVIIPTPTFSVYAPDVIKNGGKPILVNVLQDNFILTPEHLALVLNQHSKTKALVLNYPNNPVGNTYTKQQLTGLAKILRRHQIFCVCDEIYSELTYDHSHTSMGTILSEQTIVLNGVSKTFAMTGWRIGVVCAPSNVISGINKVHVNNVVSTTTNAQWAANEAFQNGYDDGPRMRNIYRKRRDVLRAGLYQAGFTSPEPSGAFYIFAKIPVKYNQNSVKFALRLAKQARVGVIPGSVFGPGGEGYLRVSYAVSMNKIRVAIKRIQKFVKRY